MILNHPQPDGRMTEILDQQQGLGSWISSFLSHNKNTIAAVGQVVGGADSDLAPVANLVSSIAQSTGSAGAAAPRPVAAPAPAPKPVANAPTPSGIPFGYIALGGAVLVVAVVAISMRGRR